MSGSGRSILFLQGLAARFFEHLGAALTARGHIVRRINFNGGDRAFWRLPGSVDFRGCPAQWPVFLEKEIAAAETSDIILFGDCRPPHVAAIEVARRLGVRIWVVEEGYLRPGWITFEADGTNGFSNLPREPRWYREQARVLPPWREPPPVPGSFRRRAVEDVLYWLTSLAARRRFPHYETHRPYFPFVEYAGWLRRLMLQRRSARQAMAAIAGLAGTADPIFLFPLQLDCDYQIRVHSPFRSLRLAIETVLASFAGGAPPSARLVVKLHPLDSGICDWAAMIRHCAVALGISGRLTILDGGSIEAVVALARGVVTVNSTVGTLALATGRPVKALGSAIYDLPGLTFQGDLDAFWSGTEPPDRSLFDAFRRVLADRVLIPGSFFSDAGLKLAVAGAIGRIEDTNRERLPAPTSIAAE